MFITIFLAILNVTSGEMVYTNAGHTPPVLIDSEGKCSLLPLTKDVPLGISEGEKFAEKTATMKPQDTIFIYTDGVTEAMNANGEEYGEERMLAELASKAGKPLQEVDDHIYQKVT